ncbi:hypothetical protein FKM82_010880 [Ascaphus truei]
MGTHVGWPTNKEQGCCLSRIMGDQGNTIPPARAGGGADLRMEVEANIDKNLTYFIDYMRHSGSFFYIISQNASYCIRLSRSARFLYVLQGRLTM